VITGHQVRPKLAPVHALRPVAIAVAAAATVTLAAGCASFDKAFGKQEQVVQFKDNTPPSVMLRVRASCSHIPGAIPERVPPHPPAVQMADDIRYLTSNASDADLARLAQCLARFPSVVGLDPNSPDGS
jgi:hypothetical protein